MLHILIYSASTLTFCTQHVKKKNYKREKCLLQTIITRAVLWGEHLPHTSFKTTNFPENVTFYQGFTFSCGKKSEIKRIMRGVKNPEINLILNAIVRFFKLMQIFFKQVLSGGC